MYKKVGDSDHKQETKIGTRELTLVFLILKYLKNTKK